MDKCIGMTVAFIKENGRMGFNMDREKSMCLEKV